jgi:hypothetical protein
VSPRVEALRDYLREFADFPENRPALPRPPDETLDVPIFLQFMVGSGGAPAFTSPAPLNRGDTFLVTFGGKPPTTIIVTSTRRCRGRSLSPTPRRRGTCQC